MKFAVQREALLKPLQFATGVVEKRQTMAVLSNVLLDVHDNHLTITGSDLEVELIGRCDYDLQVSTPGSITVPGRKFFDICKNLPSQAPIEVEQKGTRLIIKSGKSQFSLSTITPDEYPALEIQEDANNFTLQQKDIKLLAQRTHFAMAQQDVRYYLNGMLLEITKDHIRTVATDGHRLAINTINKPHDNLNISALIPRKAVLELLRLLEDTETELNISISPNHIRAYNDEFVFTSKLLEGNYPSYDRVLPKNGDKIICLERDQLKQTLLRASILSNEKYRGIRFELKDNTLRIQANNPEQEEADEELNIVYPHDPMEFGFNVDYIIDVLNTLSDDDVKMVFTNSDHGMLIEESIKDCDSVFLVMPMRL